MEAYLHPLYLEDVAAVAALDLPWEKLKGKTLVLSGATGLIGSCLVDVLMRRNISCGLDCRIVALGRSEERARGRFAAYWDSPLFSFAACDINEPPALAPEAAKLKRGLSQ